MASFASGIFVHTAARTVIIAPDCKYIKIHHSKLRCYIREKIYFSACEPVFLLFSKANPHGKPQSTAHFRIKNKQDTII